MRNFLIGTLFFAALFGQWHNAISMHMTDNGLGASFVLERDLNRTISANFNSGMHFEKRNSSYYYDSISGQYVEGKGSNDSFIPIQFGLKKQLFADQIVGISPNIWLELGSSSKLEHVSMTEIEFGATKSTFGAGFGVNFSHKSVFAFQFGYYQNPQISGNIKFAMNIYWK